MHRRYLAALAVAAIAGGAMPAAASASLKLGITSVALQNRSPSLFYGNVKALKMGIIRTQINWANIAAHKPAKPEDPNDKAYNWKQLDKLVLEGDAWATPANGTVIYDVWGTPRWARKYKTNVAFVPVPDTTQFRHFMRALALRYNGKFVPASAPVGSDPLPRITHWEIWNEPNNALGLAKPGGKTHKGTSAGAKAYITILEHGLRRDPRAGSAGQAEGRRHRRGRRRPHRHRPRDVLQRPQEGSREAGRHLGASVLAAAHPRAVPTARRARATCTRSTGSATSTASSRS